MVIAVAMVYLKETIGCDLQVVCSPDDEPPGRPITMQESFAFTLYPDGEFDVEYDYNKPENYEEADELVAGE